MRAARPRRAARLAPLAALCALVGAAAVPAQAAKSSRPSALALSDKALYEDALRARKRLGSSRKLLSQRSEWEAVVQKYRVVVLRYPRSGYSDNALLGIGDLYRQMASRFERSAYRDEAVRAFQTLVAEYPSSSLGEKALYAVFEMAVERNDRRGIAAAARQYLEAYPDARRAGSVKNTVARRAPAPEPALPRPQPPGLAQVYNLRFWSGEDSTRVVLDLEKQLPIKYDRLSDPDRLWIDLIGARLHPNLNQRAFPIGDGLLEQIRIGPNRESVIRVVLDFKRVQDQSIFFLKDPVRLVIDVRGQQILEASGQTGPASATGAASTSAAGADPPPPAASAVPVATATTAPGEPAGAAASPQLAQQQPEPSPAPPAASTEPAAGAAAPVAVARGPEPPAPDPPQANRAGSYSLARQLGLHARRIVIDAGHGGHDPGTIGRGGLREKDLVLDVALRLARLVRDELHAEVILTRSSDVFVPLEERTAIANAKRADLFLSVHANASRNRKARGIETYFLSFARNAHAEEVAARENAISEATLKDLQNLVKAIVVNSKIDESRDFAAAVQESLIGELKPHYPAVVDRGVHTAPFYVLIGANMPSILAEIAFVSHPQEEQLLKTASYRDRIARSLLAGVGRYLDALNRTQARQLTAGNGGSRVGRGGGSR